MPRRKTLKASQRIQAEIDGRLEMIKIIEAEMHALEQAKMIAEDSERRKSNAPPKE